MVDVAATEVETVESPTEAASPEVAIETVVVEEASVEASVEASIEAPSVVDAESTTTTPQSVKGRAENDPRVNSAAPIQGTVSTPVAVTAPAPALPAEPRAIDEAHPSHRGRAANDPRARSKAE